MAEKAEPGRTVRAACRQTLFGEYAPNNILVDVDTEQECDLLSDVPAPEATVPTFHCDYGSTVAPWGTVETCRTVSATSKPVAPAENTDRVIELEWGVPRL